MIDLASGTVRVVPAYERARHASKRLAWESTACGGADGRAGAYALSLLCLREHGFVASLRTLARELGESIDAEVRVRVQRDLPPLGEEIERALHRMAYEALACAERHARATGIVVLLTASGGTAELSIRDDGVGLDQRVTADWRGFSHLGLRSAARAIEAIGGRLTIAPMEPRGIHARARVPLRTTNRATPRLAAFR